MRWSAFLYLGAAAFWIWLAIAEHKLLSIIAVGGALGSLMLAWDAWKGHR